MSADVATDRVQTLVDGPLDREADYVLYWMTATRRPGWNYGLQRAAALGRDLGLPLVVLEALRCDYRWASDRHHAFLLQGMADNRRSLAGRVRYYPYVEPEIGHGKGLLVALAQRAAAVVTDDQPAFFLRRMIAAAARRLERRFECVDSVGLMPLRASPRAFMRAVDLRRFLQRSLLDQLERLPLADPLADPLPEPVELPASLRERWPEAGEKLLAAEPSVLAGLPIDHSVGAIADRGGHRWAEQRWRRVLDGSLGRYHERRREVTEASQSGLSGHLHHGHIGPQQLFSELAAAHDWSPGQTSERRRGQRSGWWGLPEGAESFLDQLITWRELGQIFAHHREDYREYSSLPDWARQTLADHVDDARDELYSEEELREARTSDEVWNAAQRQLRRDGRIHNYLRMLWGKKVLGWSEHPRQAADRLVELNNRYAVDGRDANSYSGIYWVLGRHDRAWGPERPIFGKVRYMTTKSTRRKLRLGPYLERFGPVE